MDERQATGPWLQMFTEADNYTQDLFRWLALVAIVAGLSLEIYSVVIRDRAFDIQTFGIGVGVLFVAMGGALRLKAADTQTGMMVAGVTAAPPHVPKVSGT